MSNTQHKADVKKIYDFGASDYHKIYLNPKSLYDYEKLRRAEITLNYLSKQKARNILDLGCGPGIVSSSILEELPNSKIIGIDFSKAMIESANLIKNDNLKFIECDAENTPFEKNTFDAIYALGVFEKFQNLENIITESYRILKPGGILYFTYPNYFSLLHNFRNFAIYLKSLKNMDDNLQKLSLSNIKNLFVNERFKIEKINYITFGNSLISLPWTKTLNIFIESFCRNSIFGKITSLSSLWVVKKVSDKKSIK